ncbi:uncharacterized protein NPIL_138671 [Nephila pilipes]|uniref:Uncharacterized protein n=1 Tax=Nephila pilipes TaxID=299642 RepID=A0A8X6TZH1_NEPPI|nr:uncharacterized protein NPIL_138671 [Nephila pilipes]
MVTLILEFGLTAMKRNTDGRCLERSKVGSESEVRLLCSKNRVAALKPLGIPRLELMACCIGTRLVNTVIRAFCATSINVILCYDSTVVLWWIKEFGEWGWFLMQIALKKLES